MHTDETTQKLSKYQTGKTRSEETQQRIAAAKKGVQRTTEHTAKHAEAMSKAVYDLMNKNTGERFQGKNLAQFAKDNGSTATNIYAVVNGKRKQHKGWHLTQDALNRCTNNS